MGASKSKRSRSVNQDRSRYGASRPLRVRPTLPVVVVVCDDAKTACAYFAEIKREVKSKVTVEIIEAPYHGAAADDVVSRAIKRLGELSSNKSHDPDDAAEAVWALIDLEIEPHRQSEAQAAKKRGTENGVSVALSNPCFEVWTLAHLIDTGEAFNGCAAVSARVRSEWKKAFGHEFGAKAQADYAKLMQSRADAVERTKRRSSAGDQSWTEIYKVVQAIMSRSEADAE